MKGYDLIYEEEDHLIVNSNLRSVYQNLPWDWINHEQKRISRLAKKNLDLSGTKDLNSKRLNEKARTVL